MFSSRVQELVNRLGFDSYMRLFSVFKKTWPGLIQYTAECLENLDNLKKLKRMCFAIGFDQIAFHIENIELMMQRGACDSVKENLHLLAREIITSQNRLPRELKRLRASI